MHRLREELRNNYLSGHAARVSGAVYDDLESLWPYFESNYCFLLKLPRDYRILEIGSGSGSLIAWLAKHGFTRLTGLDISPEEVRRANQRGLPLLCAEAYAYLEEAGKESFDVVIAKAVFEHMTKEEGANLLKQVVRVLAKPGGLLLLDVPNMDWLLSNHERYMDLTHETGYTRESMSQMLRLYFQSVEVRGSVEAQESVAGWVRIRLVKPLVIRILRIFFRIMGEGASNILFESRSIVAIGRFDQR